MAMPMPCMSRRKCEFKESARQAVVEDSNSMVGGITYLGDPGLLKQKQDNDSFTKSILQSVREGRKLPLKMERWSKYLVIDGVLCRQSRNGGTSRIQIVVPQELRSYILDELHSKSGHLGAFKTFQKIKERYFWPGYEQEILKAVQRCDICQPLVGTGSNTLAKILVDEIVCRYGMPEIIHSDQGSNFVSEVI